MSRLTITLFSAGLVLASSIAASAATVTPFGLTLGDNGRTLVTIRDLDNPGASTGQAITDGTSSVQLDAIAYFPKADQFFGYGSTAGSGTVFSLDRRTAVATPIVSTPDAIRVAEVGFDFNSAVNAARLVSTAGDNQVFFPNNDPPNIDRFVDLFYVPGDVNEGANPSIFTNAYTNAVPDPASTQQFVLDSRLDSMATLGNNLGTLETVGTLRVDGQPLDFTSTGGLDIFSRAEGDDTAYALLTTAAGQGLYLLDLFADEDGFVNASLLGSTGSEFGALGSLAVAPIPLPATAWLLMAGLGGLGLMRRRRAARAS